MHTLARTYLLLAALLAGSVARAADTLDYPGLGSITIERSVGTPARFVIFLSGDGGWNKGVVDMARHLADEGALVAGVDVTAVERLTAGAAGSCAGVAGSLEGLAHYVEQRYGLRDYLKPILVGYSSGATLAYATLAQAPAGTFQGAISLGFCPDLEWRKPLCRGEGLEHEAVKQGFVYRPAQHLQEPWIALQGERDEVCAVSQTRAFVAQVPGAEIVSLPLVGHGYSVERNWLPQFLAAYRKLATDSRSPAGPLPADVGDLPLTELPIGGGAGDTLAILVSGDGGWAGLDRAVAAALNARGLPVVGWDSLRYFWTARTPQGAALDLDRVIRHYTQAWGRSRVLLVGYSQGADVLPFMVNRLPPASRRLVAGTALIGVGTEAFFEFSVTHWLATPRGGLPVAPEVNGGRLGRVACIYGAEDAESPCRSFVGQGLRRIKLPGGHHFAGDYERVAGAVLEILPT
jgi:type IV secretory pathway VirJ component